MSVPQHRILESSMPPGAEAEINRRLGADTDVEQAFYARGEQGADQEEEMLDELEHPRRAKWPLQIAAACGLVLGGGFVAGRSKHADPGGAALGAGPQPRPAAP